MLFSELYSAYYNAVAEILKFAVRGELDDAKIRKITEEKAFGESALSIPASLKEGRWQLITPDMKTAIKHEPSMPLTDLEKRWLKAVSQDPRVKLFEMDFSALEGVEPLFSQDDVYYYDRCSDGDRFTDGGYTERFKIILNAVKTKHPLKLELDDPRGKPLFVNVIPEYLEYSEKDDKFRLITSGCHFRRTVNLSTVLSVKPYLGKNINKNSVRKPICATVTFELFDGRNTLERAMLHFAHFEKTVTRIGENEYTVTLTYDKADEAELLIRIISFGHYIKVTAPDSFVSYIKNRLKMQKDLLKF